MPVSASDHDPDRRSDHESPARPGGHDAPRVEVHRGPVFRVERVDYTDAAGRAVRKDLVRHPGAVTVVPRCDDGTILMVRVGRLAVGRFLLEFCAGKLEPGEAPAAAAARELEEEVGRRAGRLEPIASYLTSPGFCDERMHAFLARDLDPIPTRHEPGEEIEVVAMTPDAIDAAIANGEIEDGKSIAAWHLARTRFGRRLDDPLDDRLVDPSAAEGRA